jgi:hypothetical protein
MLLSSGIHSGLVSLPMETGSFHSYATLPECCCVQLLAGIGPTIAPEVSIHSQTDGKGDKRLPEHSSDFILP